MKYKKSKYNYRHQLSNGDMLLCNMVMGSSSFLKIPCKEVENFEKIFSQNTIDDRDVDGDGMSGTDILISKGYFIPEHVDELSEIRSLYYENVMDPRLSLTIMPTEKCNFRCPYCYENFEKGQMSSKDQVALLKYIQKQLRNHTHLHISWFGGEPLLALDTVKHIMANVQKMGKLQKKTVTSNMTTNAYLLTPETFDTLYHLGVTAYQITLDGMKEEHDKQRVLASGAGTFDQIMQNLVVIKSRKQYRFASFTIRINITRNNIEKIDEFVRFYQDTFGDDKRFMIRFAITGDYGGTKVEKFKENLLDGNEIQKSLKAAGVYDRLELNISDIATNFEPMNRVCYASGRSTYTIGSDLTVYRCTIYFKDPYNHLGKITENGEMKIDHALDHVWYIKDDSFPQECIDCVYFPCCYRAYCPLKLHFDKKYSCEIENIKRQLDLDIEKLNRFTPFEVWGGSPMDSYHV